MFEESTEVQQQSSEELTHFPSQIEYHLIQYHHAQPLEVKSYSLAIEQADIYNLEQILHQFDQFMFQNFISKKKNFLLLSDHETIQYLLHLQQYIKLATHYKRMNTLLDDLFIEAFQNNDPHCIQFIKELQMNHSTAEMDTLQILICILQKLQPYMDTAWEQEQLQQQHSMNQEHTQIIGSTVIRLRGLPWVATVEDILDFFSGFVVAPTEQHTEDVANKYQILIVLNAQGRSTGEAYVKFANEEECRRALHEKDCQNMGHRYVELFPSSIEEMEYSRKVMEKQLNMNTTMIRMRGIPFHCNEKDIELFFAELPIQKNGIYIFKTAQGKQTGDAYVEFETKEAVVEALKRNKEKIHDRYIELFRSNKEEMYNALLQLQQQQQQYYNNHHHYAQKNRNRNYYKIQSEFCVKLRGLPFDIFEEDIADFFFGLEIAAQGIHLVLEPSHHLQQQQEKEEEEQVVVNPKHTGTAFVEFTNESDYLKALNKHKQTIKNRYIEVFPAKQNNQNRSHYQQQQQQYLVPKQHLVSSQQQQHYHHHQNNNSLLQPYIFSSQVFIPQPIMQPKQYLGNGIPFTPMMNYNNIAITTTSTTTTNHSSAVQNNCIKPNMRVKNLPINVTLEEIRQFFKGFDLDMDSIRFKMDNYGRPMNEITIAFKTAAESHKAFVECNHKTMRENVIELFFVNQASFQHFQECYMKK